MPFEQNVVVITGASRGIGASLVEGFRNIGYGVVANSRLIPNSARARSNEIICSCTLAIASFRSVSSSFNAAFQTQRAGL
jgi:NAD(P)-dependent dehydrogenase (short-subunit alcohol dehydrogenase family)